MEQEFAVLQGKTFTVELQSMFGSTNYGWCVSSMPEGVILVGAENQPAVYGRAPVIQRFYFGAVSGDDPNLEIKFVLTCLTDLTKVENEYTAKVRIIPGDSEEFVSFSENAAKAAIPYGFVYGGDSVVKYGYPFGAEDTNLKYGYPCGVQDANLKYGYPCSMENAGVVYGYRCSAEDVNLKYGYSCGVQDANLKYGYPCMELTKDARPYGYPNC